MILDKDRGWSWFYTGGTARHVRCYIRTCGARLRICKLPLFFFAAVFGGFCLNFVPCPMRSLSRALLAAPLVVLLAVPKTRHFLRDVLVVLLAVPKTRGAASIPHGPALARHAGLQQCTPTAPEASDGPGTQPAPGTGGGHDLFPEWLALAGGSTLADVTTPTSSIGKGDALIVIDMQRDFVPGVLQPACPCARQPRSTLTLYAA